MSETIETTSQPSELVKRAGLIEGTEALAKALGFPHNHTKDLVEAGKLRCLKIGHKRLFDPAIVVDDLKRLASAPAAEPEQVAMS